MCLLRLLVLILCSALRSCLISSSMSILSLALSCPQKLFNVRVLHISSCACCFVPDLAASFPSSWRVPELHDVLVFSPRERHHKYWSSLRPVDGSVLTGSAVIFISNSVPDGDPLTLITASASRLLSSSEPECPCSFISVGTAHHDPVRYRCYTHEEPVLPPRRVCSPCYTLSPELSHFSLRGGPACLLQWRLAILIHKESVDDGCRMIHHGVRFQSLA